MAHALHDSVRHNAWATAQILEFCRGLDEQTLNASVPGTYGTIIATPRHISHNGAPYYAIPYSTVTLFARLRG
jgi:uncharacterized damage-inducible protein DinB